VCERWRNEGGVVVVVVVVVLLPLLGGTAHQHTYACRSQVRPP
jgi:hypothetical protein